VDSLHVEAQKRWYELELSQFDELFRLRLGSKKRIWGVRIEHHFYMIWYERGRTVSVLLKASPVFDPSSPHHCPV